MKTSSKNILLISLIALVMIISALAITPFTAYAQGAQRVDFCLTNGSLESDVFFENNPSKYFISQTTKADGTLFYLEELYRTDSLDLEFDGWYTDKGEKVTLETVFTEYTIIYDRWKETTLEAEDIVSTLEIGTPLLEADRLVGNYDIDSVTLEDSRLSVESVEVYEGLNAFKDNKLEDYELIEDGKSYSLRVELHTKNGELIDDQLMNNSTATYGLVANMVYSHDNSGIFTTQWTNRENKIQVIINYDFENYYFTYDLEDKIVENNQSPQYTVYVSNNANVKGMELFVKNANDTWASLGAVTGQFNIPANSNVIKQYRVEVTYQNGFVISSNTFTVDWYDPNAPKFIKQPMDYDVPYGTVVQVSWGLNFDSSSIEVEKYNGEEWESYQSTAYNDGAPITPMPESGKYFFRAHATKNGVDYYSDGFFITWRDKFEFTTQPQSQSVGAGLGEDIIITWNMEFGDIALLQIFKIETYDTSEGWRHSAGLTSDTKSYTFSASNFAYSQKFRLMANYDNVIYHSDEFTIEFIAGVFTSKPDSEINAVVGKDCLVEWDFNFDVEYYNILVYDNSNFVPFATTDKPEYNFTASEIGYKQFFIQAYNANDQIIGEDYLLFTITWTEEQVIYLVSFNANGGSGAMTGFEKEANALYTLPDCAFTAPEDKVFKAWDVNGVEKKVGDSITITANTIIKAIWEEIPTYIVAYAPGDGVGSTEFEYVTTGTTVTLLGPADLDYVAQEGMQFSHWKVCKDNAQDPNAVVKQPSDEITITFETYIIAIWEEIPTFIVAYGPGEGVGSTEYEYVTPGTTVTLLNPTDAYLGYEAPEGMQFSHWRVCKDNAQDPNAVVKQPGDEITITFETYIIAIWEEVPVVPTALTASYNGTILAGNKLAINSLTVKLQYSDSSEMPCAGLCEYWYQGSMIQDPINYVFGVELIGNLTITVKYQGFETTFDVQVVGYAISFNANGGTGTMANVEYVGAYTLPACTFTAPNGKQFKGWATSQNGEVISGTTNVTADLVLYAIWEDILSEEPENPNGGSGNAGGNEGGQGGSTPAPTPDTTPDTTPETTPDTTPEEEAEAGLSGGAIAGIAVGATAGAALSGFAIFWFVIKKKSVADLLAIFKK